jgi:glutaredoxin
LPSGYDSVQPLWFPLRAPLNRRAERLERHILRPVTRVVLYGKAGCCLCDDAKAEIDAVRARREFDLEEVDVSLDPVLYARYGERIPVVEVDGVEAFELGLDGRELADLLDTVTP